MTMKPTKEYKDPKSPCCKAVMMHIPDPVHFHYMCCGCDKEFELDGETEWKE